MVIFFLCWRRYNIAFLIILYILLLYTITRHQANAIFLFQYASSSPQLISWLDEVKNNGGNSVRKF